MTNGDPNCILFCLYPQIHGSIAKETVTLNKRSLEDRLSGPLSFYHVNCCHYSPVPISPNTCYAWLRAMELSEVAITYSDSGHGGDRRKRVQQGCLMADSDIEPETDCSFDSGAQLLRCIVREFNSQSARVSKEQGHGLWQSGPSCPCQSLRTLVR